MPDTLGLFPFWKVKFDKEANPVDAAAVDTFVSEVKSQGVTDLFIFSHGWNNDESAAAWLYQSFFGEVAKLMANPGVAKKNAAAKIGVAGIVWPSILWPDDAPSSGPAPELPAPSGGGTVAMNASSAGVSSKTATIAEVKSALQAAYGSDPKQQTLINDLLTFSRVGRLNATHTEVDLDAMLDTALANLSTAIEESHAEIVRPGQRLPTVDGDPTLLTMVLQNLIGNAVKFRREGVAPRIVIECEQGSGPLEGEWLFSVTDNGIGIAEEFADKVFVIFQRLHVREMYTGTGIGLALCKKIVEHHGGSIRVDTSYTSGTRILFTLSATPTTEPNAIPTALLEGTQ